MKIRVYEPALCCNTGICGTDVDQALVTFTADLNFLKELNVDVERHNLANDPMAFVENSAVKAFMDVAGSKRLPLTLVDQVTVMAGSYPNRAELLAFAGIAMESQGNCCTSNTTDDSENMASGSCCSEISLLEIGSAKSSSSTCC